MKAAYLIGLVLQIQFSAITGDGLKMYDNYCLMNIHLKSLDNFNEVWNIVSLFPKVILLDEEVSVNNWLPIAVPNQVKIQMIHMFEEHGITFKVVTGDLEQLIKRQRLRMKRRAAENFFELDRYHPLEEITEFTKELSERFPGLVSLVNIGHSVEGRPLNVVKLTFSEPMSDRKAIFIECGIHAREWVSPAACLGVMNKLIATKPPFTRTFDVHILPVFNVDGYKYSWETDRMWRKNRQLNTANKSQDENTTCSGVDLNRNFDDIFGARSSFDPCSDIYNGGEPLNQPESRALADYVARNSDKIAIYFSVHSAAQMVLYTKAVKKSFEALEQDERLAALAATAIKKATNQVYKFGASGELFKGNAPGEPFGGTTFGHVQNRNQIPYSFTIELRNREFSFLLPPDQIEGTTDDLYAGITAIAMDRLEEFSGSSSNSGDNLLKDTEDQGNSARGLKAPVVSTFLLTATVVKFFFSLLISC